MSSDEVREIIAGLREGDEVEVIYRGVVDGGTGRWFTTRNRITRDIELCDEVRVLKRAPLPEPPVGSGWFHDGALWVRFSAPEVASWATFVDDVPRPYWQYMAWAELQPGRPAVPAATPEEEK